MAKWKALHKVAEEMFELGQELMKLEIYPSGKHPRCKRSLVISTEEEAADVLASLAYFIDRNKLNRSKIDKRAAYKYRKWVKRYGETGTSYGKKQDPKAVKRAVKKAVKKATTKRAPKVKSPSVDASLIDNTTKTTSGTS